MFDCCGQTVVNRITDETVFTIKPKELKISKLKFHILYANQKSKKTLNLQYDTNITRHIKFKCLGAHFNG
jgi:hypothetical protein